MVVDVYFGPGYNSGAPFPLPGETDSDIKWVVHSDHRVRHDSGKRWQDQHPSPFHVAFPGLAHCRELASIGD
jgi:hypothetical protein